MLSLLMKTRVVVPPRFTAQSLVMAAVLNVDVSDSVTNNPWASYRLNLTLP
jgi:hypothetical protein